MKRFIFLLAFLNYCFSVYPQAEQNIICQYGFTFEISLQKQWGYLQPVVLSITPNTPADNAGLSVNDIIEKINDKPTKGENIETIISWLHDSSNDNIQLTISNLSESFQNKIFSKNCRLNTSITEKDLASIYSFYSLEDAQTRVFSCPFKTTVNPECDLILYKTFGFAAVDSSYLSLEKTINAAIQKCLEQKGLKYSERNPDLIIRSFYSYMANPNFRGNSQADKLPIECRYDLNIGSMEYLPIYFNPLIHPNQAKYLLKLGIQLIDNKKSLNSPVWECEANELLQSNYSLADYAEFHVPLMFMQYPYPKSLESAQFYYSRTRYNYTGINYSMNNLKEISEVAPSSPAEKAGIRAGDIIEKINGIKLINNTKKADSNYKQFIFKTMQFRNPVTQFTNADGFMRCMYWDKMKYTQINNEFKKPIFSTVFSYLFYFEPYINDFSGTNIVSFTIKSGGKKKEIKIRPVIYSEEVFENR